MKFRLSEINTDVFKIRVFKLAYSIYHVDSEWQSTHPELNSLELVRAKVRVRIMARLE